LKKVGIDDIFGKKTLIIGDVKRGKTRLTAELLEQLLKRTTPENITVIDMAPTGKNRIGGMLWKYTKAMFKVRYLQPSSIRAPRIEGRSKEEVLSFANSNKIAIKPLIECFLKYPSSTLVINDLSIYLQSGDVRDILKCMNLSETIISNAYYGSRLSNDKGSNISRREKRLVDELITRSEIVIRL